MFAKNLRQLRKERRLSQKELGDAVGVSASTIGMYEQNRRKPNTKMICKFAEFFGVSSDSLLGNAQQVQAPDLNSIQDALTAFLHSQNGLCFNGKPLDEEDLKMIEEAIKQGMKAIEEMQRQNK